MKISGIHVFAHMLPVRGGAYRTSGSALETADSTIVKVAADNGLVGWGEVCPLGPTYQPQHAKGARAALEDIAPCVVGMELDGIASLHRRMDAALDGHAYAKAALDIAAYDLLGKHLGARVAELLGGAVTERVPSYYATCVDTPEEGARIAAEKVAEGYPRIQLKVGGRSVEVDIEAVRKTHERIGGKARLAVDANRGLATGEAVLLSHACRDIPFVLEQPCNSLEEIRAIRGRVCHPIYIDESGADLGVVMQAAAEGLCDGFGMKVTRIGGLKGGAWMRDMCAIRSLPHTTDDNWGGDIVSAACVHLGATVRARLMEGAWLAQPYVEGHYDSRNGIRIEGGHVALPSGAGLGVEPDEGVFGEPCLVF